MVFLYNYPVYQPSLLTLFFPHKNVFIAVSHSISLLSEYKVILIFKFSCKIDLNIINFSNILSMLIGIKKLNYESVGPALCY